MRSPRFVIGMLNVVRLGDLLKALYWSDGGLSLFAKRLEKGRFCMAPRRRRRRGVDHRSTLAPARTV
ncbi:IS66 family insertion sequence element accessory protein TnpB [Paraburkholderia strydomiana]|uniref:IS66 family insertion sequence element accessory protein TnpB n=1 Tax=Paraburkholderia strydomiana TaxID=1245417 RepID=UPI0038BA136D